MPTYLPTPDTPRVSSPANSRLTKRKRTADSGSEPQSQASPSECGNLQNLSDNEKSEISTFAAPPQLDIIQRPSDGLPTPLLSPTSVNMDEQAALGLVANRKQVDTAEQRRTKTREIVKQQVNLEILLKHDELRLIDQEIAKCQVALEQLRRCTEIPYPAINLSQDVTAGTGPALRQKYTGARMPVSPAPWGVTDGPYSRHYATWLLPDSRFDGGEPDPIAQTPINGKRPAKGRHGRPSIVEDMQHAGMSSRSQRNSGLQSLSTGYVQPKEKSNGPLVLKRNSDGKMVKLKCLDCGRLNFGSAQGFINHCRIGHGRTFPSHDAAAESCGEPVEYDSAGGMVGVEPVTTTTPVATSVHPLIRSAHLLPSAPAPTPKLILKGMDGAADTTTSDSSPEFKGSNSIPFLSALVQKKGLGLDLQDAVTDAKTKLESYESDVDMSDVEDEVKLPEGVSRGHPQVAGTRQVGVTSKAPSSSPLLSSRLPNSQSSIEQFGHSIEPSPTTDSNQAPSLIDDDEEYEAHSPASTPPSELADEDVHIRVQDEDDVHQVELSRPEFQASCAQSQDPVSSPARRPSAFRRETENREEKHVSFDGASPAPEQISPDRSKRRKITK
ncbi:uncharacterized protein HMPREF1541_00506 [Cyphellophora europaea CBS 101466]|uniref:AHC1-like C2H2 zinc-finger domain-containing protein n=1 Tax=Cyphellophora europaea (strain CBS 101466) TaxID=1220924 RepID=W2SC95_CYPE1|nr:uncharacterized protein HMPREF1541_00506 [Cyphellophora europaea CBS 101466]ETN46322.1 hypothetical protein HMPREF1541_00506 [Cyphellophora europaea CBS 101466]